MGEIWRSGSGFPKPRSKLHFSLTNRPLKSLRVDVSRKFSHSLNMRSENCSFLSSLYTNKLPELSTFGNQTISFIKTYRPCLQSVRSREPRGPLIELNPDFGIQKNCPFHWIELSLQESYQDYFQECSTINKDNSSGHWKVLNKTTDKPR